MNCLLCGFQGKSEDHHCLQQQMTHAKEDTVKKATDEDLIRWQLKCLANVASELTEKELELAVSFGDQFARKRSLSPRQMEVLEDIYKRRT